MIPNTRGLVAGLVRFSVCGRTWDCMASGPAPIPAEVVCCASPPAIRASAFGVRPRCVVVVEKEAVFGRLVAAGLASRVPSVLVTGRGYPDHATRAFAGALCRAFDVPAFGLCDCDPDGLRILLCYARGSGGSRALGYSPPPPSAASTGAAREVGATGRGALPALQWLGLRPSSLPALLSRHGSQKAPAQQQQQQQLSPRDRAVLRGVVGGGSLSRGAAAEAAAMGAQGGRKAELEALGEDLPHAVEAMLLGRDWIPLVE